MVIKSFFIFLLGLIFLVKGSDYLVKSASAIAKKLGISEFVIGLTLVAVGTSIPELASSIVASIQHAGGIIIGNIVGSNIINIGLIVGLAALLSPIKTEVRMLKRDGYIMLFASVLFYVFALNEELSKIESGLFVLLYIAYTFFLFEEAEKYEDKLHFKEFATYFLKFKYITSARQKIKGINNSTKYAENSDSDDENCQLKNGFSKDILTLVLSCAAIIIGAKYFIEESIFFAELLGVPHTLIGTTLVAIGTSLPELAVAVSATRQGYGSIALGNAIGSNITNVLMILGISGLLYPIAIAKIILFFTAPVMLFMSVILLIFIGTDWEIKRWEGAALILLYAVFLPVLLKLS